MGNTLTNVFQPTLRQCPDAELIVINGISLLHDNFFHKPGERDERS
jgi:hypothetical protein